MSEATHTHTPGPWVVKDLIFAFGVTTQKKGFIATAKTIEDAAIITAAPDFFKAVAGDPDLLDQPIDWVAALLAEYGEVIARTGYSVEDVDSHIEMCNKVRALISDVRAAIAKATNTDK